jgi:hypothetical protein
MLTTVKGYFEKGKIVLSEIPKISDKTEVIVTFLIGESKSKVKLRVPGGLKGKIHVPANFNEPLDDLKDYM